jgi:hypothetical protein
MKKLICCMATMMFVFGAGLPYSIAESKRFDHPTYLSVKSKPPGADVEVGPKIVNGIYQPGTGRHIGNTPCRVELTPSDLSVTNDFVNIVVNLTKPGYIPATNVIGLGSNGRLKPGKTYTVSIQLNKAQ